MRRKRVILIGRLILCGNLVFMLIEPEWTTNLSEGIKKKRKENISE
jgi:hypothetical protein